MAERSLRVTKKRIESVKSTCRRSGFARQIDLAEDLKISLSTLSNFLNGRSVNSSNFIEICQRLGLDWKEIADFGEDKQTLSCLSYVLHLSDLHFGSTDNARIWYAQLAEDLRYELKCSRLDALILSGDIASSSTSEEYTAAKLFINRLCQEFQLEPQQIVIVPGNHDLNWELAESAYIRTNREDYQGELREGCYLEESGSIIKVRDEATYKQRFAHFSRFYQEITGDNYPLEYDQQYSLQHLPKQYLLILGLNSAWQIDHHYSSRASINPEVISNVLSQIRRSSAYENCLKIAVWHHPLNHGSENCIKERGFMERLAADGFRLCLHGGIHRAESSSYHYHYRTGGQLIHIIGAGKFGVLTQERSSGYPWQYNLLKIEDSQLTVETRQRDDINGSWQPDNRWFKGSEIEPMPRYLINLDAANLEDHELDVEQGKAYAESGRYEEAIACYKSALQFYTREAFPQEWAEIQQSLGQVYSERIQEDKAENIDEAIACFQAALEIYTREAFPEQWAMTQNSLGEAYSNKIKRANIENLERAIASYEAALQVYTLESSPQQWVKTQNNLGDSYMRRLWGDLTENTKLAIRSYEQALVAAREIGDRSAEAHSLENLGHGFSHFLKEYQRAKDYYQQFLELSEEIGDRVGIGNALNCLGNVYSSLEEFHQAIEYYQQSLAIFEEIDDRSGICDSLYNLSRAYDSLGESQRAKDYEQLYLAISDGISDHAGEQLAPHQNDLIEISGCDNPSRRGDVIFVHGLKGDARGTWHPQEKQDDNNFWCAWLGEDFPDVGIWSLGYEMEPFRWKGNSMPLADRATNILDLLDDYEIGDRPIIFITHSLGGLLVKQMLRSARDFGKWSAIASQTRGIVFLSTPHSGSDMASWIQYIGGILQTTVSVEELQAHHSRLRELNLLYRNDDQFSQVPMLVYCETRPTKGILVVNQTSADPGIKGVIPVPMDFDHISICKVADRKSQIYRQVKRFIDKNLAANSAPTPDSTIQIPHNLPTGACEFIGRSDILEQLHQNLQQTERTPICAVVGMGGVGKTELALQYALHHRKQGTYPGGLCWIRAGDEVVGTQIVSFARTQLDLQLPDGLDLAEQVTYCWRHWRPGNVLLIFDDVRNYRQIKPYLPPAESRFKVLITTRQQKLRASFERINLDVLTEEAAIALLMSLIGSERIEAEPEQVKSLCQQLGYLPWGLELVGRYLQRKPDLSLEEISQRLGLKHRSLQNPDRDMTAQLGVEAAFELSWLELSQKAQKLACFLSLFALTPIPWAWVEQCWSDEDVEELEDTRDDELVNMSLLERVDQESYQLHQLIREFLKEKLKELTEASELKQRFCLGMVTAAQQIPETPTKDDIVIATPMIPHLAEVATTQKDWLNDEDLTCPFVGLGRFYQGQGFYKQALPWYQQCLSATRERLGDDHPDVAASLDNLANLYYSLGRYGEAEPLFLQALELRKHLLGDDHPDVAASLNNLAGLYSSQGRYGEAEPLYLQALELSKHLLGDDHPDVATSLNNLANLYSLQGRYVEAEPLFEQALELSKRLLSDEHPNVASSLNNLAGLYSSQGRYGEAEPLYLQALELSKRLLGDDHLNVATSLNNLALLYFSQGRYAKAEPLFEQALELSKRLLGDEHPNVASNLNNLARLYSSQERYGEAEPLFEQALELSKRLLGDEHPNVATSLNNLALLYFSQGRYAEAEPLYQQALAMFQRLFADDHPDIAQSLKNLAGLYQSQERLAEAETLYQQALAMFQRLFANDHPDIAQSLKNLAGLYQSQERLAEAETLYQQALAMFQRLFADDHPNVVQTQNNLANLHQSRSRPDEAESQRVFYEVELNLSSEEVSVGGTLDASVDLRLAGNLGSSNHLLEVQHHEAIGSELNILLNAPGFQLDGDNTASLPLDPDANGETITRQLTQTATFRLTALRSDTTTITAELYRGDTFETTLKTQVQVAEFDTTSFTPKRITTQPRPVPQPDFILRIQTAWNDTHSACQFQYQLRSFRIPSLFPGEITYHSEFLSSRWLEQMRGLLGTTLETISDALPEDGRSRLMSLGQYLFTHLLPRELQNDLHTVTRLNRTFTLLVLADQDAELPWELLHDGQRFLSDRFIIGRWFWELNDTRPHEFPVGAINVAHYADVEQPELWTALLEPPGSPPPLPLPDGVLGNLDSTVAMRGLHLIRYSQSSNAVNRRNAPVTLDDTNNPQDIERQMRPAKLNLRRNRPLVSLGYMRRSLPELTTLEQTWASAFIRAGCSAFTGSLWAIDPAIEAAFISGFYHRLWTGGSLGEAFHASRQLARAVAPDSLDWLAYVLFGDPMARPYRPVEGKGYAVVEPIGREIDEPLPPGVPVRFRLSLRRTPPVWHEERVIEVAENLTFENLQAHVKTFGLQVTPDSPITMSLAPTGNYLGWFTLVAPPEMAGNSALVQVFLMDGMLPIHSLMFSLTIENEEGSSA